MANPLAEFWAGVKAALPGGGAGRVPYPQHPGGTSPQWRWIVPPAIDWESEAGPPPQNSLLMLALTWIRTNFVAAPLGVHRRGGMDDAAWLYDHALPALLRNPNPAYDGRTLLQALVADYKLYGSAYLIKIRNASRSRVVELWWEPQATIRPVWPSSGDPPWIDHYDVYRNGYWWRLPYTEDVVAWTWGVDPATRRGWDPLAPLLYERYLAAEVQRYRATMLRNLGVPGAIIAPAQTGGTISRPAELKAEWSARTTGERRGEPIVFEEPTTITFPAVAPAGMGVDHLDNLLEERLTAALGLSRLVINLGEDSTYANKEGAERAAWQDCILPLHADLTSTLDRGLLLADFTNDAQLETAFNTSKIAALAENEAEKTAKWVALFQGDVALRSEARAAFNLTVDKARDNVYYSATKPKPVLPPKPAPTGATALPGAELPAAPAEVVPALPGKNGTG